MIFTRAVSCNFCLRHTFVNSIIVFASIQLKVISDIEREIRSDITFQDDCVQMEELRSTELLEIEIVVQPNTKAN